MKILMLFEIFESESIESGPKTWSKVNVSGKAEAKKELW